MSGSQVDEILARLTRIEDKVDKTNGRVKALELAKAYADGARHSWAWLTPLLVAVTSGGIVAAITALLA